MKKIMYFAAALLVLVGCQKKENVIENSPKEVVTIKGSIVLPQTPNKIAPAEEWQSAKAPFDMLWEEGDKIYIYNQGDPDNGQVFTLIEGVGTTEGTFSGTKLEDMSNYYVANVDQTGVGEYIVEYIEDNFSDPYIFGTGNKDGFIIDNFGAVLGLPLKGEVILSKIEVETFEEKDQSLSTFTMSFEEGLELNNTTATMVYFPVDASELITIETINLYVGDELLMSKTLSEEKGNLPEYNKVTTFPELGIPTYVDLGLPSGTKWATMNVGATAPEGYGDYFAWGETRPKTTYADDWINYFDTNNGGSTFIKYYNNGGKTTLDLADDAAHVNWGGNWRMPTKAELEELQNNCTWTWTTLNNISGYEVKGPNNNTIFLPVSGWRSNSVLYADGDRGYYWSSSLYEYSDSNSAYDLYFSSSDKDCMRSHRCDGLPVRPVCK
ncbi:MAG: DUF1566 domain-containing protein [Paludibacteraceae bacterium]|nr:DUF1566 domain-containing protein [Paludibacteraceae bacterium]